ncbi:ABC transporter permease [Ketogulonicigenium vulgare]|uniref:ABC transporter, inner membrane subunit n=1 Tax=Ketogulonicigenium vulgare (strain WSH-001) TaxID=759362 RepID=F9YB38_KETVW|nr:ABC transporter permease [Ketogulonicigenium vulgare]ADO44065.1 ABC transporter, inner membrane subunit [Ketogulonicigenium vulgare Y25]AEM42590.1 ABC transporter, inner membrane subunit [Ketogulonicigenium vulgare WSH-001]AOZ53291.1 ABC transporter, inner membrane subunit [Ketogulonicigenium vulgare]
MKPTDTLTLGRPIEVEDATFTDTVWAEHTAWIDRIPRSLAMIALLLVVLLIWGAVHHFQIVSRIILPSPQEVGRDILFVGQNLVTGGYMLPALWMTTQEILWGFFFAILIGFSLGVLVGETTFGERAVLPYLVAIDTMPKVAFAPLFLAWLGFGISSKVALAAFIATFPIVVGTAAGLHAADENARMMFRSLGASRWQTLVRMKIPAGLPHIFTGLKIGAVGVMAGAITAEFLGGGKGFGELIRVAASQLQTPRVFSLILYLSVLGFALFWSVVLLERRLVFWHRASVTGIDDRR